jgi:hypothetical protein
VIVHGGAPGIDKSFSVASKELGVMDELYLADFSHVGGYGFQNREMLQRLAELCLICHGTVPDEGCKDLARQAIAAAVPTYLVELDHGKPRRLQAGDDRLRWHCDRAWWPG